MKPTRILPLGTPDEPASPPPIEPMDARRPGPFGDGPELALLSLVAIGAAALIIRGFWPW